MRPEKIFIRTKLDKVFMYLAYENDVLSEQHV